MRGFAVAGYWAGATLTAADQARFFLMLDRLVPAPHRAFARSLLETVSPLQTMVYGEQTIEGVGRRLLADVTTSGRK